MRTVWRFGLLYLLALLLVFALGHGNQMERARLQALKERLAALEAQEEALLREGWEATRPHRVLEWAEREGFVPMSRGRWVR
ncbi:hypothetical protein [Thermus thermamylovorans]|uniref:Cell division protein FtsL n=1 Tax=Thermus thermamylovorans TaxID=2509362 RepID=A0A4Q9B6I9_9DEIN|nr:hypothetical protein [Thermus thermamylovorans]TBH21582.1 hypothetical protein ETP66_02950 [Thermus thermamylovorans]